MSLSAAIEGESQGTCIVAYLYTYGLLLICRKTELNPTAPSGSGESSTVVIRDPVSEVDHSRDSNTPVN